MSNKRVIVKTLICIIVKKNTSKLLKPNTDQKGEHTNAEWEKEGDLEMFWDGTLILDI